MAFWRKGKSDKAPRVGSPASPLDQVPLFSGLSADERAKLAKRMVSRTFVAGDNVVMEGHEGIGFFVITSGTADAVVNGVPKRSLQQGDYFGEIAMLSDGVTRSATVTATGQLECLAMTAWEFRPFLAEYPAIAKEITSTMEQRLAQSSDG